MNVNEMSKIIGEALRNYGWSEYRTGSLPEFIANAIAIREQETHKNDLRSELKDKTIKLDVANGEIERLRGEIKKAAKTLNDRDRQLEEARAATPHFYHPSTAHMGDCSICGGTADTPQHDTAQWQMRCEFAEAEVAQLKKRAEHAERQFEISEANRNDMRRRLVKAEVTITAIKEAMK